MSNEAKFMVPNDEDIVISGLSGRFPKSKDLDEFKYNLFNGINMATDDSSRWLKGKIFFFDQNPEHVVAFNTVFAYR